MVRYPPLLLSFTQVCAIPHVATNRAIIVRYPIETSTKLFLFCDAIAASIARYEKYRCWASKIPKVIWLMYGSGSPAAKGGPQRSMHRNDRCLTRLLREWQLLLPGAFPSAFFKRCWQVFWGWGSRRGLSRKLLLCLNKTLGNPWSQQGSVASILVIVREELAHLSQSVMLDNLPNAEHQKKRIT